MRIFLLVLSAVMFVSCDKRTTKLQYMPDMADSATVKSGESPLPPPKFAVAMDERVYPKKVEDAERLLRNPLEGSDKHLMEGKKYYGIYCAVCHGPAGKGNMTLTKAYAAKPPNIVVDAYKKRGDGFFFYRITNGAALMPAYGHSTSDRERWQIVHYVRFLQSQAGGNP